MWVKKKSRAVPARRRLQKSTAMGVWGITTPFMMAELRSHPSGVFAGTALQSEASTTVSQRPVDSGTSPEALKENHPRKGRRRQSEKKEGGRARDDQGESAQRGRSRESITRTRAPELRPSPHLVKARAAAGRQTLAADFRRLAASLALRAARLRRGDSGWGKGVRRSVPPSSPTTPTALGARRDPDSCSVCSRATGRDFRRKPVGVFA